MDKRRPDSLPDPHKSRRALFARAAQELFLSVWVHGGLLSAANAVLIVSIDKGSGAADPNSAGPDAWRAVAAELASGVEGRIFPERLVEKAAEVRRLHAIPKRTLEKPRPWDTWSSSDDDGCQGSPPEPEQDGDPTRAGAASLLTSLLRSGRSEEALLAGCRLAGLGGANDAWKCVVERAAASWGSDAGPAGYIDAVAKIYSAFGGPGCRRRSAASAAIFESAFAGAVAALSGDLPVRRGWRSHAASNAQALAPGSPFMVALHTVPRTLKAAQPQTRRSDEGDKVNHVTVVVTSDHTTLHF